MLVRELKNSATRLLTVVVYFKLRRWFFNEGTQAEAVEKFDINAKALSKLLTRCRYMGGFNPRKKTDHHHTGREGKAGTIDKEEVSSIKSSSERSQ